jgi:hypothetical protein
LFVVDMQPEQVPVRRKIGGVARRGGDAKGQPRRSVAAQAAFESKGLTPGLHM